jgi:hypothetical protein
MAIKDTFLEYPVRSASGILLLKYKCRIVSYEVFRISIFCYFDLEFFTFIISLDFPRKVPHHRGMASFYTANGDSMKIWY